MEYLDTSENADRWNQETLVVLGVLSLVLHHSTNEVLLEASNAILLNTSLASTINSIIDTAHLKGPALVDHDERTGIGESLLFVLLLNYFSLRRSVPPR